jgi:hemolysin activation/secretion protein
VIELRRFVHVADWLGAQPYAFYDAGIVWNDNAPAGFDDATLNSAGAGVRLTLPYALFVSYEAAKPLTRTPAVPGDKDLRHFFSVSISL